MKKKLNLRYYLKKFNILYFLLAFFVFLIILNNVFFKADLSKKIVVLREPISYEVKIPTKALIVKNEFVYYLGDNQIEVGNSKVEANSEIGDVDISNIDDNFKTYLQDKIETYKNKLESENEKKEDIDFEFLKKLVRDRNIIQSFDYLSNKKENVVYQKDYIKEKLYRYSLISETLETGKIISKNAGMVSNNIDGLENVYDFSIVDLIDEDDFNFGGDLKTSKISGIKIIDNLKYYLCLKVKSGGLSDISENQNIKVKIDGNTYTGLVKKIKNKQNYDLVVAEFSSGFDKIKDKRYLDVEVAYDFNSVYELPRSALFTEGKDNFVYTIDSFNNIKKAKVSIKFTDFINNKIYLDPVKSYIGPFSNIIKVAENYEDGDVLR